MEHVQTLKIIQRLFGRVLILYLGVGLFFSLSIDQKKLHHKILNELRVPLDYLILFSDDKIALDRTRFQDQVAYYTKLNDLAPDNPAIKSILAFCAYYQGSPAKAVDLYQQAFLKAPYSFWDPYNLGLIFFEQGDYPQAISYFEQALSKNLPANLEAVQRLWLYRNLDDPKTDADGIEAVSASDVGSLQRNHLTHARAKCYELIIRSFYEQKNYPAMIRMAQLALADPSSDKGIISYYLGLAAFHLQQLPNAVVALQQSIRLNPNNADAYFTLGQCFGQLNNSYLAQSLLLQAEKIRKNSGANASSKTATRLKIF